MRMVGGMSAARAGEEWRCSTAPTWVGEEAEVLKHLDGFVAIEGELIGKGWRHLRLPVVATSVVVVD